jgi:hypothetical protein
MAKQVIGNRLVSLEHYEEFYLSKIEEILSRSEGDDDGLINALCLGGVFYEAVFESVQSR